MRILQILLLGVCATGALAHPPTAGTPTVFSSGIPGPEGLAFTADGTLITGSVTGELRRINADGSASVFANVGDSLAGITVLRDGRVLAAAFDADRVWAVEPSGAASVFASGVDGPNFIVRTRSGQILVSASNTGDVVDITSGTPVVRATGLNFPDGMAIGPKHALYLAELGASRVVRMQIFGDGSLGSPVEYATGLTLADGIALDRAGNLLVVGGGMARVVDVKTGALLTLSTDPVIFWPSNIAFGRGHGFSRRDAFLANFGLPLGSGTTIVRLPYNHAGAKLIR